MYVPLKFSVAFLKSGKGISHRERNTLHSSWSCAKIFKLMAICFKIRQEINLENYCVCSSIQEVVKYYSFIRFMLFSCYFILQGNNNIVNNTVNAYRS